MNLLRKARAHYWAVLVPSTLLAIVVLLMFWIAMSYFFPKIHDRVYLMLGCTAMLIAMGGVAGMVMVRIGWLQEKVLHSMSLDKIVNDVGLFEIGSDSSNYDYETLIANSRQLVVVLNDGRTWISVHRDRLRKRFADLNKETIVYLIHPCSAMIEVLARKGSKDRDTIKQRILESIEILKEIRQPETELEILGHYLFNPHSVVVADRAALLTPYFFSRGRRTVPVLHFIDSGKDCFFRSIMDDLERLRIDSESLTDFSEIESSGTGRSRITLFPTG